MNEGFKVGDRVIVVGHPDDHYNGVEGEIVFIHGGSCLVENDTTVYELRLDWLRSKED